MVLLAVVLTAAAQRNGKLLFSDDFTHGLSHWTVELEKGGTVEAKGGILSLDVPAGCTVWFRPELHGPVAIEYEATMIRRGGPSDRVSDLNCFWMAGDARVKRSGKFADYNTLRGYYVGQGGNTNSTTRFRRYIGDPVLRPLLPEHDLKAPLLEANTPMHIRLRGGWRPHSILLRRPCYFRLPGSAAVYPRPFRFSDYVQPRRAEELQDFQAPLAVGLCRRHKIRTGLKDLPVIPCAVGTKLFRYH